ncbi:hypothetical protein NMY22_g17124 [Coprinellus aureogranulatus]|nr:hypothetical protein NMY22_g17124 [Coprinellus aureogranulatus]
MHATLIRRSLGGLVPPKVATPKLVSGGSGAGLKPLVDFYGKLPKGNATQRVSGLKGRYFNGENASGAPFATLIVVLFGIGYTIDYNMHLSGVRRYGGRKRGEDPMNGRVQRSDMTTESIALSQSSDPALAIQYALHIDGSQPVSIAILLQRGFVASRLELAIRHVHTLDLLNKRVPSARLPSSKHPKSPHGCEVTCTQIYDTSYKYLAGDFVVLPSSSLMTTVLPGLWSTSEEHRDGHSRAGVNINDCPDKRAHRASTILAYFSNERRHLTP